MSKVNDGGNAFPIPGCQDDEDFNGISKRDYFAAKALAAIIAYPHKDGANCGAGGVPNLAAFAYEYADAMLLERAK